MIAAGPKRQWLARYSSLEAAIVYCYGQATLTALTDSKAASGIYRQLSQRYPVLLKKAMNKSTLVSETDLENILRKLLDKKLGSAIKKAYEEKHKKAFLCQKEHELASALLPIRMAENIIPHIPIMQLHEKKHVRGIKYKNKWYFSQVDLLAVAKKEKRNINRINQLLKNKQNKNRIALYKIIAKIEKCRGQLSLLSDSKAIHSIINALDEIINEAHDFRDLL